MYQRNTLSLPPYFLPVPPCGDLDKSGGGCPPHAAIAVGGGKRSGSPFLPFLFVPNFHPPQAIRAHQSVQRKRTRPERCTKTLSAHGRRSRADRLEDVEAGECRAEQDTRHLVVPVQLLDARLALLDRPTKEPEPEPEPEPERKPNRWLGGFVTASRRLPSSSSPRARLSFSPCLRSQRT